MGKTMCFLATVPIVLLATFIAVYSIVTYTPTSFLGIADRVLLNIIWDIMLSCMIVMVWDCKD